MKKKAIYFNESQCNEATKDLDKLIQVINSYTEILNSKGYNLTIDTLQEIGSNPKEFKNNAFKKELKEICDHIGLIYEEQITFTTKMNNPIFQNGAHRKAHFIYKLADSFSFIRYYLPVLIKCVNIVDNVASKTSNAESTIKEFFTEYTETEKQNKVLDQLQKLQEIYKELEKHSIYKYNVDYIFAYNANQINPHHFKATIQ